MESGRDSQHDDDDDDDDDDDKTMWATIMIFIGGLGIDLSTGGQD